MHHLETSASEPRFWAIIPATGVGQRFGGHIPKQYLSIAKKSLLEHSASLLVQAPYIQRVIVAISPKDTYFTDLPLASHPRVLATMGGAERWSSVSNALDTLKALGARNDDWVIVHDAVRPCLTQQELESLITTVYKDEVGGFLGGSVADTLRHIGSDGKVSTVDRSAYLRAMTPQMYRLKWLEAAFDMARKFNINLGDETTGVELLGLNALYVPGLNTNIKVTLPEDVGMAEYILSCQNSALKTKEKDTHVCA